MPPNSTKISKISRGSMPPNPPPPPQARLHENNLQYSFLHESVEKAEVFSCNSRICFGEEYALKYSGFDSSICSPKNTKRRFRCHQTVPRFQNFPRGACPRTHLATALAVAPFVLRNCRANMDFVDNPLTPHWQYVSQVIVTASNICTQL